MGDLRFRPEFRFYFGGKYCIFFSNSRLISSLHVFFFFRCAHPCTCISLFRHDFIVKCLEIFYINWKLYKCNILYVFCLLKPIILVTQFHSQGEFPLLVNQWKATFLPVAQHLRSSFYWGQTWMRLRRCGLFHSSSEPLLNPLVNCCMCLYLKINFIVLEILGTYWSIKSFWKSEGNLFWRCTFMHCV